jgi:hypothetical protein
VIKRTPSWVRVAGEGRRSTSILSVACLAALVVASYGGVLFGGRQFAFRDSAHFYAPASVRVGARVSLAGLAALLGLARWAHLRPLVQAVP